MSERSPRFGLSATTSKPAHIAANELSRAINALNAHHEREPAVWETNSSALRAGADSCDAAPPDAATRAEVLHQRAAALRASRADLLETLLPLREPLVDLLIEEHAMAAPGAMFTAHVEPRAPEDPPEAMGGVDLDWPERLRVLDQTLRWTLRITRGTAGHALGPAYLLSYVIEHPTPDASNLRAAVTEARDELAALLGFGRGAL